MDFEQDIKEEFAAENCKRMEEAHQAQVEVLEAELAETAGSRLPQVAGLSEEHMTVTDRFIRKIQRVLANEKLHIKNYAVSKNYYDGMDETLQIGLDDGAQITLTFSGRK